MGCGMGVAVGVRVGGGVGGMGEGGRVAVGGKVTAMAVGRVTVPGAVGVADWQAGRRMKRRKREKRCAGNGNWNSLTEITSKEETHRR